MWLQARAALAAAEAAARRDARAAASAGAEAGALHTRATQLLSALREMLRLVMRCVAAAGAAHGGNQARGSVNLPTSAGGSADAFNADDIASLTSLSVDEVQFLLGPGPGGRRSGGAAVSEAQRRCDALLDVLEATLLPAAQGPAAAAPAGGLSKGRQAQGRVGGRLVPGGGAEAKEQLWDVEKIKLLVHYAEREVQAVEGH